MASRYSVRTTDGKSHVVAVHSDTTEIGYFAGFVGPNGVRCGSTKASHSEAIASLLDLHGLSVASLKRI